MQKIQISICFFSLICISSLSISSIEKRILGTNGCSDKVFTCYIDFNEDFDYDAHIEVKLSSPQNVDAIIGIVALKRIQVFIADPLKKDTIIISSWFY